MRLDHWPTITQTIEFDAGHRLQKHEGKCRNVHGHRYRVELEVAAPQLDGVGRVVDFSVVKQVVGGWVDQYWDHGFLYEDGDPVAAALLDDASKGYRLPYPPTAENIARYLGGQASLLLIDRGLSVVSVVVWETPSCRATWRSSP